VKAIQDVVSRIEQLNSISVVIAAAVEEQTATTNDMARTLSTTANTTEQVSVNIQAVATGANEVSSKAQLIEGALLDVKHTAKRLVDTAGKVDATVSQSHHMSVNLAEASALTSDLVTELKSALHSLVTFAETAAHGLGSVKL
jgi:methyl-accepting chemotaxis protein